MSNEERFSADVIVGLRQLSKVYPSIDATLSRIALLNAALSLPKDTVHVISDIHGEYKKLRHIINNASGSLRPLVESIFAKRLSTPEQLQLLNLIYYPAETYRFIAPQLATAEIKKAFVVRMLGFEFEIFRNLAKYYTFEEADRVLPADYKEVFREIVFNPNEQIVRRYAETLSTSFIAQNKEAELLRMCARVIRNLLISEIVVAGDLGDRGPRIDKVIDFIMHQPNVKITWGNHDASWLGACLGDLSCIATVLRFSLRYRRLSQLEEGYGIPMAPLEKLVRDFYSDDPADRFPCKGEGLRESLLMSRMQKAMAIMQFKLEAQTIKRNPQFNLDQRNLLHLVNLQNKTINIDGQAYPLLDCNFPTVDWSDPYKLSEAEEACMSRLRKSFVESSVMWKQMRYLVNNGAMYLLRDRHLIFHACVPVDDKGEFLEFEVDGKKYKGRALFDALNSVVQRSIRQPEQKDLDMLWYLWGGPLSPWFGKDKMATFEGYFIADESLRHETKNPYFHLIHEKEFCFKILKEFGIESEQGLIVNGHVPVQIESGESPLKRSNMAVTIDGAFSEAYGDKGYTLVLEPEGTFLAQHHHFASVEEAVKTGADIIPSIEKLRNFNEPRLVGDTEKGSSIRQEIVILQQLIAAYKENIVRERL